MTKYIIIERSHTGDEDWLRAVSSCYSKEAAIAMLERCRNSADKIAKVSYECVEFEEDSAE